MNNSQQTDSNTLTTYFSEMGQVETLVNRLLHGKYASPQDLWNFQVDLVNHQIKLQEKIQEEKEHKEDIKREIKTSVDEKIPMLNLMQLQAELKHIENRIVVYDYVHLVSRQIGDALAWIALKNEEKQIRPLTENDSIGATSSGPSLKGLLGIAQMYAAAGMGFPIIHDITNCLRIGDITFVSHDSDPITIEVKTRIVEEVQGEYILDVSTYGPPDVDKFKTTLDTLHQKLEDLPETAKPVKKQLITKQLKRQLNRMSHARMLQIAQSNKTIDTLLAKNVVVLGLESAEKNNHWDLLPELVTKAKETGYASAVVDNAFLYVVTYADPPLDFPWSDQISDIPFWDMLFSDLINSDIWFEKPEKNALYFGFIESRLDGECPPYLLPLLLFPLQSEHIIDIIWGRLSIGIFINLGKLVETVQNLGFNARLSADQNDTNKILFEVNKKLIFDTGEAEIHFGSLHEYGTRIIHEFLSLEGFTSYISQLGDFLVKETMARWAQGPTAHIDNASD